MYKIYDPFNCFDILIVSESTYIIKGKKNFHRNPSLNNGIYKLQNDNYKHVILSVSECLLLWLLKIMWFHFILTVTSEFFLAFFLIATQNNTIVFITHPHPFTQILYTTTSYPTLERKTMASLLRTFFLPFTC